MKAYISADIGGSHISCAAIDPATKHIIPGTLSESDVDNGGSAEEIIKAWSVCFQQTIEKAGGLSGIGFAMPGPFDYSNGISKIKGVQKFEKLYDVDVQEAMRTSLKLPANMPVRFVNDATAFAMGEAWGGKAATSKKMMAITLGTGFGSAFLQDGVPVLEGDSVPDLGCVYHLPYKDGIADEYFSTRWFVKEFNQMGGPTVKGVKEIADLANEGDANALSLFRTFGTNLGGFLADWMAKFEVDFLIIGGNISNAGALFIPHLNKVFADNGLTPQVAVSELKEDAALIGAARLVDDSYYNMIQPLLKLM